MGIQAGGNEVNLESVEARIGCPGSVPVFLCLSVESSDGHHSHFKNTSGLHRIQKLYSSQRTLWFIAVSSA